MNAHVKKATLICGANEQAVDLPEGNMTISQLIERYGTSMNMPTDTKNREVRVNDKPATTDRVIQPGDQVEVVRQAGPKG